jgi:hypothetical protein
MDRRLGLALVLAGILALNLIAILMLGGKVAREQADVPGGQQAQGKDPRGQEQEQQAQPAAPAPRPPVRVVILEDKSRCPDCYDIREYVRALNETLELVPEEGDWDAWEMRFAADSRILPMRLPALAFNATIEEYPQNFIEGWDAYGFTMTFGSAFERYEGDWYVLPTLNAPYLNVSSGQVRGYVTATYLDDSSCDACYDPHETRAALLQAGVVPHEERTLDAASAEGKRLTERYNITRIPTIVLTGDLDAYPALRPSWEAVGTVETDGAYRITILSSAR